MEHKLVVLTTHKRAFRTYFHTMTFVVALCITALVLSSIGCLSVVNDGEEDTVTNQNSVATIVPTQMIAATTEAIFTPTEAIPTPTEDTTEPGPMVATLTIPSLGRSWQGAATYTGEYTTLFVGINGIGDWPHCSGSIDRIVVRSLSGGPEVTEDFNDPSIFSQVGTTVYIAEGRAVFDHLYNNGGLQFVYRSIPVFSGPVEINVIGQIDWWENNCGVYAGVADDHLLDSTQYTNYYPGIAYTFFGGGCSVQGPLVMASGTDIASGIDTGYTSDGCSFTSDGAPWFAPSTPFEAILTLK